MKERVVTYRNGLIFNGCSLCEGYAARFEDGYAVSIGPEAEIETAGDVVDLNGDILSPGYVDLQVNGGGGVMFNDEPSVDTLDQIAKAHRRLGVAKLLPTLITDTADKSRAAIDAAIDAVNSGIPGIAGLHLEGPHLSVERKGAHDPKLIRPMSQNDVNMLVEASRNLPVLKVTVAPESVGEEQVKTLARSGILVSLGHTDASFDVCRRYFTAGARCVTHLFNAMSQLSNREPGLVGAALATGGVSAGLIADAVHVHPETIRTAWAAKTKPGQLFLVSDAMAVAGTDLASFELGGRHIHRRNGTLKLENGTLAGADLDLTAAIKVMVERVGVPLEQAIRAATTVPSGMIGRAALGLVKKGQPLSELVRIPANFSGPAVLQVH